MTRSQSFLQNSALIFAGCSLLGACAAQNEANVAPVQATGPVATLSMKAETERTDGFWRKRADYQPAGPFVNTIRQPVSTFSADVDTASYAVIRKTLRDEKERPSPSLVRTEEMVNYFSYAYPKPANGDQPLRPTVHVFPTPWNARTHLIHVAVQAYEPLRRKRPAANIVLLLDLSASIRDDDKLPLMKRSIAMLSEALGPRDHIAIVGYNKDATVLLEPTVAAGQSTVLERIGDDLRPRGRTDLGKGLLLAYRQIAKNYRKDGINRIILFTDGDITRGATDPYYLRRLVARQRRKGISLSILGFGLRKYDDQLLQTLVQSGDGAAAFIDGESEARRVLVEGLDHSLTPVAQDVKLQVEFNPAKVAYYRLLGYETRRVENADFANDRSDAGDIAAGQSVTAIYEVKLADPGTTFYDNRLRYRHLTGSEKENRPQALFPDELATLTIRYKRPGQRVSNALTRRIYEREVMDASDALPADIRFSTAVAAFGQYLRRDENLGDYDLVDVLDEARPFIGNGDTSAPRKEFLNLVKATMKIEEVYSGF